MFKPSSEVVAYTILNGFVAMCLDPYDVLLIILNCENRYEFATRL